MALTLVEAAKLRNGTVFEQAVVEQYASSAGVLTVLPFKSITGNALAYNREETLPGVGFRGVNEGYRESTGVLNPVTEPLVIAGGVLDVDRFILRTEGVEERAVQEAMKIKSLALSWERTFFKGDTLSEPREFDGLQKRIIGGQLITAADSPSEGGNPLSLIKLDELIDQVKNPTHLFMNKGLRRRLTAAARDSSVSGSISWDKNEFGQRIAMYNDLPIIIVENDNNDFPILGFDEASPGGGAPVSTSIYCASLGDGALVGIQNGAMDVEDMGLLEEKPVMRTLIEWYSGIAIYHGKSVARMWGISNAPVIQ